MDNVRKETLEVSVVILTTGNRGEDQRRKGQSSSPAPNSNAKTDSEEKALKKIQATEIRDKFSCRYKNCHNQSCSLWHPPVCQNYKTQTGCSNEGVYTIGISRFFIRESPSVLLEKVLTSSFSFLVVRFTRNVWDKHQRIVISASLCLCRVVRRILGCNRVVAGAKIFVPSDVDL